jgi:hypothetical protein
VSEVGLDRDVVAIGEVLEDLVGLLVLPLALLRLGRGIDQVAGLRAAGDEQLRLGRAQGGRALLDMAGQQLLAELGLAVLDRAGLLVVAEGGEDLDLGRAGMRLDQLGLRQARHLDLGLETARGLVQRHLDGNGHRAHVVEPRNTERHDLEGHEPSSRKVGTGFRTR